MVDDMSLNRLYHLPIISKKKRLVMKGKLIKIEERWMVGTVCYADLWSNYIPLHPDYVKQIERDSQVFDNIEARIAAYPNVEFDIVSDTYEKPGKGNTYAKLIPSKEQQKQIITEIMDEVDKLAHQYNPVMKLDAEFIRAGFKAGYNKAKSTLYTEEQVREAINMCHQYIFGYNLIESKIIEIIQSLKQPKD
jgi:hypothetical protein